MINQRRHLQTTEPFKELKQKSLPESFFRKKSCGFSKGGTEVKKKYQNFHGKNQLINKKNFFLVFLFYVFILKTDL